MCHMWIRISLLLLATFLCSSTAAVYSNKDTVKRYPRRLLETSLQQQLQQRQQQQQRLHYYPQAVQYPPPYEKQQIDSNFITYSTQSMPDANNLPQHLHTKKSLPTIFSSYAPPASGIINNFQYRTPQTSVVQLPNIPTYFTQDLAAKSTTDAHILVHEQPAHNYVAPNQNKTLEAVKILTSSLLEASGEAPLVFNHGAVQINPMDSLREHSKLNRTDVVILKAQKHAYLVPIELNVRNDVQRKVQDLYEMRTKLERAFTINQFIFIIRPDKINFLNKLI